MGDAVSVVEVATAARLTASQSDTHAGAVDLSSGYTTPARWWMRVVWRDTRVGTDAQPETPDGCPDLDGIEWWIDGALRWSAAVPQWSPTDEWGGVITAPDGLDVGDGTVAVSVFLIVGQDRAEVTGRFTPEPELEELSDG